MVSTPSRGVLQMLGLILAVAGVGGCGQGDPLQRAGLTLAPPDSWRIAERSRWMVPGTPLAAWSGPDGSSLTVYRTLPAPGAPADALGDSLANRLTNLPELTLEVKRTEEIGGSPAARVEVVAPGMGDALAPSGVGKPLAPEGKSLRPTRQVTVVIPRARGPLCLSWHMPEVAYSRLAPEIELTLRGLGLSADDRPPSQSY